MEVTGLTRRIVVRDQSEGSSARRMALRAAEKARFDSGLQGRVSLIAAELSSNLLKHAGQGGSMLINSVVPESGVGAVELVAIDRGPGMADRKSTRLNSSHSSISYAVFCLKK